MNRGRANCIVALIIVTASQMAHGHHYRVGYQDISTPLSGRVWYPADRTVSEKAIQTAPFFKTYYGADSANIIGYPYQFPLMIVSHGSGGKVTRLDWIADYFVRRGWIVAGVNHAGNTHGDNSARGFLQVWERPQQITKLIDALLADPKFGPRINRTEIVAVGHSAGGTTVLLLAGARMSAQRFQNPLPMCQPLPTEYDDERCEDIKNIDFGKFSKSDIEGNYRDPRIRAIVAIDPAFSRSFPSDQSAVSHTPRAFVFSHHLKEPSGEIYSREFLPLFPVVSYLIPPHSIHISFVTDCNKHGLSDKIPICIGDEGFRDNIQRQCNQFIQRFFEQAFRERHK